MSQGLDTRSPQQQGEPRRGRQPAPRPGGGLSWGTLIGGLAVLGLGVWAWNVVAPDLRRYLKMRNM